jgi:hypothetical protein
LATRFYLPASGTPPLAALAVNANWELTNSLVRLPCYKGKKNTALATDARTWPATTTQQWCWWQYQSLELLEAYSWTTADTVSMVIGKCGEPSALTADTHLAYVIRVVSNDGSVIRGVIGLYHATSTEFPDVASAATRIHSARTGGATNFSSQIGDRIIIEIGLHGVTPAAVSVQMRKGDPTAVSDFALTAGLTTDLDSWVELSRTVVLGFADSVTENASAGDSAAATKIVPVAVSEGASSIETSTALLIKNVDVAEPASATDEQNAGAPPINADVSESIGASESPSTVRTQAPAITEAGSAADSQTAGRTQDAALTEASSAADAPSADRGQAAQIVEAGSSAELQAVTMAWAAGTTEVASASDSSAAIRAQAAANTEAISAGDEQSSSLVWAVAITEAAEAADQQAASLAWSAGITEAGNAQAAVSAAQIQNTAIRESCSAIASQPVAADFNAVAVEYGHPQEFPWSWGFMYAGISETGSAADATNGLYGYNVEIEESGNPAESSTSLHTIRVLAYNYDELTDEMDCAANYNLSVTAAAEAEAEEASLQIILWPALMVPLRREEPGMVPRQTKKLEKEKIDRRFNV